MHNPSARLREPQSGAAIQTNNVFSQEFEIRKDGKPGYPSLL